MNLAEYRLKKTARLDARFILVFSLLFAGLNARAGVHAAPPVRSATVPVETRTVPPEKLDQAISDTISDPEYSWRLPRESVQKTSAKQGTFMTILQEQIEKMFKYAERIIEKIIKWIEKHLKNRETTDDPYEYSNWQIPAQTLLFVLIALTATILAIALLRAWKRRHTSKTVTASAINAVPDIRDENVTADQLPSDEWMNMARGLLDQGELRLALRAMFFACLVYLAHREKLTIAKAKSNREYIAELRRRAHDQPELLSAFAVNVGVLERVWYGMDSATQDMVTYFSANLDTILDSRQVTGKGAPAQAAQ